MTAGSLKNAAEGALAIAAMLAFAVAVFMVAAPIPPPSAPEPPLEAAAGATVEASFDPRGNPFRGADDSLAASSAPLAESALNVVLYGTWRGSAGAAAMISADGAPQRKVAVGEEIVAGVTLEEVQDEFVVINNNGAREAVAIANRVIEFRQSAPNSEALGGKDPAPSSARLLRDGSLDVAGALTPSMTSADADAPHPERSVDTIAAAAPHETE